MSYGFKKKISLEVLIKFAEMKKKKNKIQDLKNAKKAAREKVLQQIQQQQAQQDNNTSTTGLQQDYSSLNNIFNKVLK